LTEPEIFKFTGSGQKDLPLGLPDFKVFLMRNL